MQCSASFPIAVVSRLLTTDTRLVGYRGKKDKGRVAAVGDGDNDAVTTLARADVGIAMGVDNQCQSVLVRSSGVRS